ncbi:TetR/AcrR family transcriptional regulator [Micromonospora sp. WMMD710]|uniref:TetR/AcrR family transcriptional regulator n=1 Tax=Micromonospora sp. WMMD710 TaxID=3016085 RepID=UPI0024160C8A|nr:TetR/AcrR family transcriptional regulator [Micromonospora sp. WMMD710]MDG4757201.1 TetR/AcrR family transcriptional regulator [Micromonospora sp. WMMD710]
MPGPAEKATEQDRRDLIVTVARELAETEGWAGVSTRRLSERAEIDIGDIYRHFADLEALLAAVAVCAFADLAADLAEAHADATDEPEGAWSAVATAYLDFAYANPEVYDAMLALTPDLALGDDGVPGAPRAVFTELRAALAPLAEGRDLDTLAEVGWSLLHGVVMLTRGGRLRPEGQEEREAMIAATLLRWP